MKKVIAVILLICVMTMSFVAPLMATEVRASQPTSVATGQEITPFTNMTRIYYRNHNGRLQFRVWSITNGRWMTPWTYV